MPQKPSIPQSASIVNSGFLHKNKRKPKVKEAVDIPVPPKKETKKIPKKARGLSLFHKPEILEKQPKADKKVKVPTTKIQHTNQLQGQEISANRIVRQMLRFPATLIGDHELDLMIKMDTPVDRIQRIMKKRAITSVAFAAFGLFLAVIIHKYFGPIALGGILFGGLVWFLNARETDNYYKQYAINRQMAFTTFTRITGALLNELSTGKNLYSIFGTVKDHIDNDGDRKSLERLMIQMQVDSDTDKPFLNFAHEFSTTDRSELTMLDMHQMYLGNINTSGIQSLINDSNKDYEAQTTEIRLAKIKRFRNTAMKVALSSSIVLFGYLGIYLFNTVAKVFSMMHHMPM